MAFLGFVAGEHSSGSKRKLTGITKAGSLVARRLIVEAAWAYRMPAKIGQAMMLRQQSIATSIRDIAWKAQVRLCDRYRRMLARGKKAPVVITAIAREFVGFIWAIGQQFEPKAAGRAESEQRIINQTTTQNPRQWPGRRRRSSEPPAK
jgi:hypothetical protein